MVKLDPTAKLRAKLQMLTMGKDEKQMVLAMEYVAKKHKSALITILDGPKTYSQRITATAQWGDYDDEDDEQSLLVGNRKSRLMDYSRLPSSLGLSSPPTKGTI